MIEDVQDFLVSGKGALAFVVVWVVVPLALYGVGLTGPAIGLAWAGLLWAIPLIMMWTD